MSLDLEMENAKSFIEELTLYILAQQKQIEGLEKEIKAIKQQNDGEDVEK